MLTRIKYIDEEPPHYVDRLFHIRKFVEAWNYKISTNFIPSWIPLLDESMMTWRHKFDPGWVVLHINPNPFGIK